VIVCLGKYNCLISHVKGKIVYFYTPQLQEESLSRRTNKAANLIVSIEKIDPFCWQGFGIEECRDANAGEPLDWILAVLVLCVESN